MRPHDREYSVTKSEVKDMMEFYEKQMIDKISAFLDGNLDEFFEAYLLRKYDIKPEQLVQALKKLFPENFI